MERKSFDAGSIPDWFTVAEKHILYHNDCLENSGQQSYHFSSPLLKDSLVLILPTEIFVVAMDTEPTGAQHLWNLRVDPNNGNILQSK